MFLNTKVITRAKKAKVVKEGDLLKVYVKSPPVKGRANREVIEVLAEHFKVKKSDIKIVRGEKSARKVIKIV